MKHQDPNLIKAFREGVLQSSPEEDRAWIKQQFALHDKVARMRKTEEKKRKPIIEKMIKNICKSL
jgi:hypothetical protein